MSVRRGADNGGANEWTSTFQRTEHLADRLALRPAEAAKALGFGERTLRQILPELPHVRVGGVVLLPVAGLQAWLQERTKTEKGRAEQVAEEVLRAIGDQ